MPLCVDGHARPHYPPLQLATQSGRKKSGREDAGILFPPWLPRHHLAQCQMMLLLMIVLAPLNVFGAALRSNDTDEQIAVAAGATAESAAGPAAALPPPSLFLVLAQPLRSLNDLRSLTSREEVDDPSRVQHEEEVEPSKVKFEEEVEPLRDHSDEEKLPDEDQTIARYMRPVRRKMMTFVNRPKRHHNRENGCGCCRCSCCPRRESRRYAYDDLRSIGDLTSREDADEPQRDFVNRRKRYNREDDDCRCCRCPQSTRRRYEYNDESSFESRESSRDFRRHPPQRRRDDDFERPFFVPPSSEFPPSPRRRTYDWAPPPRRYSSYRHRPPPSPRAVGPYHARGAPGQRQGGCLNQMRCGSGAFARALQMKPSPFPWMPDWMSERGRPRRGMLLGLDSRYNQ